MNESATPASRAILDRSDFQALMEALVGAGYAVAGPTVRDGAIVYAELDSVDDLPIGMTDVQDNGRYRLEKRQDGALFGYVLGPKSWKQWFFPPHLVLWQGQRQGKSFEMAQGKSEASKLALLGARSCELNAIAVQDKVFLEGPYVESNYRARREGTFVVAVNCVEPGGTCFCVSMKTGPRAREGFDLSLTEIIEGDRHFFVVETGSKDGEKILAQIPHREATRTDIDAVDSAMREAEGRMGRSLETDGLKEALYGNLEHRRLDEVAERCMACANCTLVCPTCFCSTVEDVTDLAGNHAERHRKWDSCFTREFSYIYGGHIRRTTRSRYRQWLTHKLATWQDQFGVIGCVGCGRCITWCPVGIDITEEAGAIQKPS